MNEENAKIVREFIRKDDGIGLGIGIRNIRSLDLSYFERKLGYIKVCAKFDPHTLEPHEKDLRIFDYLTKNRIVTINHSAYSPDMAPSTSTCSENFIWQ